MNFEDLKYFIRSELADGVPLEEIFERVSVDPADAFLTVYQYGDMDTDALYEYVTEEINEDFEGDSEF